ncbi:MAG: hypothetical protein KAT44_03220, partial [Pirellulales bacterium]|nr:hypothetical protein [Pirellulales bacterium]
AIMYVLNNSIGDLCPCQRMGFQRKKGAFSAYFQSDDEKSSVSQHISNDLGDVTRSPTGIAN